MTIYKYNDYISTPWNQLKWLNDSSLSESINVWCRFWFKSYGTSFVLRTDGRIEAKHSARYMQFENTICRSVDLLKQYTDKTCQHEKLVNKKWKSYVIRRHISEGDGVLRNVWHIDRIFYHVKTKSLILCNLNMVFDKPQWGNFKYTNIMIISQLPEINWSG